MRLLQATREQLHDTLTREVEPFEIAQKARLNPYSREYVTAIRYLTRPRLHIALLERGRYRVRAVEGYKQGNRRIVRDSWQPLSTVTEDKSMEVAPGGSGQGLAFLARIPQVLP